MRKMLAPHGIAALPGSMLAVQPSAAVGPPTDPGVARGDGPQLDVELVADGLVPR